VPKAPPSSLCRPHANDRCMRLHVAVRHHERDSRRLSTPLSFTRRHTWPSCAAVLTSRSTASSALVFCLRYAQPSLPQQHAARGCGMLLALSVSLGLYDSRNDWIASPIVYRRHDCLDRGAKRVHIFLRILS